MSVEEDVVTLIRTLCNPPVAVLDSFTAETRGTIPGIVVEQRETNGVVDSINRVDTLYCNVIVRGAQGEKGRLDAAKLSADLYTKLLLVMDTELNGEQYLRIYPDSVPFRTITVDGKRCDFQFGLELKHIIRGA